MTKESHKKYIKSINNEAQAFVKDSEKNEVLLKILKSEKAEVTASQLAGKMIQDLFHANNQVNEVVGFVYTDIFDAFEKYPLLSTLIKDMADFLEKRQPAFGKMLDNTSVLPMFESSCYGTVSYNGMEEQLYVLFHKNGKHTNLYSYQNVPSSFAKELKTKIENKEEKIGSWLRKGLTTFPNTKIY